MADKAPAWEITGQLPTVDLGPAGTFVPGIKVTFRTAAGAIGTAFVPEADYTVERVRSAVAAKAATVDAVAGLKG